MISKPCELVAFVCHVVQINLNRCEEITNKLGKDAVDIWMIKGFFRFYTKSSWFGMDLRLTSWNSSNPLEEWRRVLQKFESIF